MLGSAVERSKMFCTMVALWWVGENGMVHEPVKASEENFTGLFVGCVLGERNGFAIPKIFKYSNS